MKKIISHLDKTVTYNPKISCSEGVWRSEHNSGSYDLWSGDSPNILLNDIYYWPEPFASPLPVWPYYFIETRRCDREWYRHFSLGSLSLTLVLEGVIEFSEDNRVLFVGPGEVMIETPRSSWRLVNADDKPTHKLVILFSNWQSTVFLGISRFLSNEKIVLQNSGIVEKKMRQIGRLIKQKRKEDAFLLSEKAYSLWLELFKQCPPLPLPKSLKKIHSFMEKKQYIINDVGELARVGVISHSTLLRLFREHHNCTPHAFLRSKQLELGAALLKCSSVKEAAQQCGFDDAAHFSRSFKEQFGISPSKYKKQI